MFDHGQKYKTRTCINISWDGEEQIVTLPRGEILYSRVPRHADETSNMSETAWESLRCAIVCAFYIRDANLQNNTVEETKRIDEDANEKFSERIMIQNTNLLED